MPAFTFAREAPPSLSDQIALFRNLAQYMKSGIPMVAGLAHAQEQCSGRLRPVLKAIQHALEVRHATLADAFRDHYPGGDPFLLALLEQGEVSGTLEGSFRQLEQSAKKRQERGRQLLRDLAYPMLCFLAVLVLWPVPQLFSKGLDAYLIRAVPPLALLAGALFFWLTAWPRLRLEPELGRTVDRTLMALPLVGKPYRASVMARFGRALSLLVRSGLALDRSLALAGQASGSPLLEVRLKSVAAEVRSGRPLAELLAPLTDILAPSFVGMIKTGEQTGELDTMLEKAADLHEAEADSAQALALTLAGPLLNIGVLLVGAYFVITLYKGYLDNLGNILQ